MYNPCIRGWITYYSHFYRTQLRPTLKRIDAYVIRWARRKFKRMAPPDQGREGLVRPAAPREPDALRPLATMSWQRPNIGSRVTREGHARFWERLGVKLPRATRHEYACQPPRRHGVSASVTGRNRCSAANCSGRAKERKRSAPALGRG